MAEPESLSSLSSEPYSVLKTIDIEGLKIELIKKEATNDIPTTPQECGEEDIDDADDTSTVCLEDAEVAKQSLQDLMDEEKSFFGEMPEKLTPIAEEIQVDEVPVNEEAEEGYSGAAGLWAKDYQLPCFNNGYDQGILYPQRVTEVFQMSSAGSSGGECQTSVLKDLTNLSSEALVFTKEQSNCGVCKRELEVGRGLVLKDCLHTFCRRCLIHEIENSQTPVMMCPFKAVCCQGEVRDDEIKALLTPEAYEKYVHEQLVRMEIFDLTELHESYDFVENKNIFRCDICLKDTDVGDGIVLKNCLHQYCKVCLRQYIETSDEIEISCPFRDENGEKCIGIFTDTEFRSLITIDTYLNFLRKSLKVAEAQNPNAYHCKTPDCPAWVEILGELDVFNCPTCNRENCVQCKAVHQGVRCADYQEMIHGDARRAREVEATENQVRGLIAARNTQRCPKCGVLVQRIEGCRHMVCATCKHDFQWEGI